MTPAISSVATATAATRRAISTVAKKTALSATSTLVGSAAASASKAAASKASTSSRKASSTIMNGQTLLSKLVPPSKLASNLNWNKGSGASVLTVNIHTDRIGLRVGYHPSSCKPSESLDDLPLLKKKRSGSNQSSSSSSSISMKEKKIGGGKLTGSTHQQLSDIIQSYNVCGLVVNWPVQNDTGRLGYAAGRVLWTLEQLVHDKKLENRPVCLWDGQHTTLETESTQTDRWGRNPKLGHSMTEPPPPPAASASTSTSGGATQVSTAADENTTMIHSASVEQYCEDEKIVAKQVWEDFVKTQWPDMYQQCEQYNDDDELMMAA
mmetsp:Transcript_23321/g.55294  ORF Transcript_23321/g.55294 Transcript_23321/m.55294 type:complete len:323 (-) Transcript_23321:214-1182(-)